MEMDAEQIERERRTGRIAGIAGIVGIVLFVGIGAVGLAPEFRGADGFAASLAAFPEEKSDVLVLLIIQAVAILLFIPPLVALFNVVKARSEALRPGLIGLCIAGPLFFAASLVASYFAIEAAADLFDVTTVDEGLDVDDEARDVYLDQGSASIASGLEFAGRLGLTFMMIYLSLNAMRSGVLTRFWGTLGMALGVGVILLGPPALLAFFLAISLMVARFWPGGMPPAWDAGRAIPWPKPGEEPQAPPPPGEETARPEDFEDVDGSATELTSERPGRRDNKRKRKRKQRD